MSELDLLDQIKEQQKLHNEKSSAFIHYRKEDIGWLIQEVERLRKELGEEVEHRKKAVDYYQGETEKVKELKARVKEILGTKGSARRLYFQLKEENEKLKNEGTGLTMVAENRTLERRVKELAGMILTAQRALKMQGEM